VNGIEVLRAEISREAQYYPAQKPIDAWHSAAKALVIRQLLLAEAGRLAVTGTPKTQEGRTETEDEALIRELFEQEVITPQPDEAACLRYYDNNRRRFARLPYTRQRIFLLLPTSATHQATPLPRRRRKRLQ
jgi:peptidyl-prolyl cis-trans isomerase C